MSDKFVLTQSDKDIIRSAFKSGKREIEMHGFVFTLRAHNRAVNFTAGGVQHKRVERWINGTRKDGMLLPIFSIEAVAEGNLRSVGKTK